VRDGRRPARDPSAVDPSADDELAPGPDAGSDPELVDALRAEIERTGPVTFARFMEIALYDPDHGYYATSDARPTRTGDFLTAPELHPAFGRCIGRQVAECWERLGRPDRFTLREYGAGAGTLAITILRGLEEDGSDLAGRLRCQPVEVNEHRRAELEARLAAEGLAGRLAPRDGPIVGVMLANEFLDALPVHRVEGADDGVRELYVGWDRSGFIDVAGEPSTPELAARLGAEGVRLEPGQRGEVCLGVGPWLEEVTQGLERGYVIVIDYGHPAVSLYAPTRRAGTLLGYLGHHVVDDPYAHVGRQDLTAHVDLTALEQGAVAAGLTVEGMTTQAELLAGLGLGDLLAEAAGGTTDEIRGYVDLRAAALRLLDPRHLGGFAVEILGRDVPAGPPLRGLAFRVPRRGPVTR
jgi:SAM-dependent MidA family methyltransferase